MLRLSLLGLFVSSLACFAQGNWIPVSSFNCDALQGIDIAQDGSLHFRLSYQRDSTADQIVMRPTLDGASKVVWQRHNDSVSAGLRDFWVLPNDVILWTERGIESAMSGTHAFSCWDSLLTLDAFLPLSDSTVLSAATVSFVGDSDAPKAMMRCFRTEKSGQCQELLVTSPRARNGRVVSIGIDSSGKTLFSFGSRSYSKNDRVPHWFIFDGDTLQLKGLQDLDVYDAIHVSATNSGWIFVMKRVNSTTASGQETKHRIIETDRQFNVTRNFSLDVSLSKIQKVKRRGSEVLVVTDSAVFVYVLGMGFVQRVSTEDIARATGVDQWLISPGDVDLYQSRLYITVLSGLYVTDAVTTSVLEENRKFAEHVMPVVDAAYFFERHDDGSTTELTIRDMLGRQVGSSIASRDKIVRVDCKSFENGVYLISDAQLNARTILVSH